MGNIFTRIFKNSNNYIEFDENDCPICLDKITDNNIIILNCKHQFHASCIFETMNKTNKRCPLCRKKIKYKYPKQSRFTYYFST